MADARSPRRRRDGPTIADVAAAAGVSPMTVSRVINRDTRVLPATRSKVVQAITQIGYVPNMAARSLAGARHCRVLLLHSNPSAAYLGEFLLGSLDAARASGVELLVERVDATESVDTLIMRVVAHRVDGVLLPPPLCDDGPLIAGLNKRGIAVAQVSTGEPAPSAHAVSIDDENAAYAMTRHILAQGHRRIGFIMGNPDQTASNLRRRGYERALFAAGIEIDERLVVSGDFTYQSGLAAAEALFRLPSRPTAIFAANDDMAAAAMGLAHRIGLTVPGDVAICGFDDTPIASTIWPELTTIRQPISKMAFRALEILVHSALDQDDARPPGVEHIVLDHELILRQSDGPLVQDP